MTKLQRVEQALQPAQPFQTLQEEAEFWDTHSAIDEIDKGTAVGFRSGRKTDSLTIRFEPDDIVRIRKEAHQRGLGPTTLARMWILDRLRGSQER